MNNYRYLTARASVASAGRGGVGGLLWITLNLDPPRNYCISHITDLLDLVVRV